MLRVVDVATGRLLETRQAAIRCPIEACDPDLPYRIAGDTVIFLTPEQAQSDRDGLQVPLAPGCLPTGQTGQCDLDGDGSARGVVIQYYNAARALAAGDELAGLATAAASTGGSCTDTGEGCLDDDECSAGSLHRDARHLRRPDRRELQPQRALVSGRGGLLLRAQRARPPASASSTRRRARSTATVRPASRASTPRPTSGAPRTRSPRGPTTAASASSRAARA